VYEEKLEVSAYWDIRSTSSGYACPSTMAMGTSSHCSKESGQFRRVSAPTEHRVERKGGIRKRSTKVAFSPVWHCSESTFRVLRVEQNRVGMQLLASGDTIVVSSRHC
jgi:hypothetical protein